MLRFILGGAGSGKSTRLTERIAKDVANRHPAWLIIPEQQANLSERTMLPKLPTTAGLTFSITGFSRLCDQVTTRFGGHPITPLQDGLCSLLMWQNLREMSGLLREYNTASPRSDANLTSLLLRTIDELRADAVTPAMLEGAADRLPETAALRPKLYDLALLYAAYDNSVAEAFDGARYDAVAHLAELLSRHDYFAGGHVYIDSFTSFTAEEYDVLRHILRQAAEVTITLCLDDTLTSQPSHESLNDTYRRLLRLCEEEHVPVEVETLTQNHRTEKAELQLLERSLWDLSKTADALALPGEEERGAITLLRCSNVYAEVEATALHVLDLVHQGYRFGDIAVVVRDAESYRGILDAAFERYGIPFYFSEKTSLSQKPLSRLILSALRAVAHGWQAQDILTLLKTGLCPVSTRDLDLFEQYVSTWNITGAAFAAPTWTRNPDGYTDRISARGKEILEAANRVRETIMTPLLRLHSALRSEDTLPARCAALYAFMQDLSIAERSAALAEQELAAGYLKQASETVRVYDTILATLTQISAHMPSARLDTEEFATALSMVFDATEIASVPSLHDSVTVGSAATLRVENVAVSFVLGLNEGEFPKAVSATGLLCDSERRQLAEVGIKLSGDNDMRASEELLYLHRAMTKPSDKLFASLQLCSPDGNAKSPSVAYNRLLFLFPYLKDSMREFDLSMIAPQKSKASEAPAMSTERDDGLYQSQPPSEQDLPPHVLADIFRGDSLWLSQSRIQTFVQCPYSYFCQYYLAPREREVARIDAADSGTFLHFVLEHFLSGCLDEQGVFRQPDKEKIEPLSDAIVSDYLRNFAGLITTDLRTLHIFRRLRALTLTLLRDILEELSHSRFSPCAFELNIGGDTPDAPAPYEIPLDDGRRVCLGGTIDRVDIYRKDGTIYFRVIDYKSSAKEFSLDDVRHGINLQMLIYLFTLCRPQDTNPAGVLYVATTEEKGKPVPERTGLLLDDTDILLAMNDELNPAYLAGISQKKDGTLTGTARTDALELQQLEEDIRETLRRIGEDMLAGRARRTPSEDACRFCTIRQSCPDAILE